MGSCHILLDCENYFLRLAENSNMSSFENFSSHYSASNRQCFRNFASYKAIRLFTKEEIIDEDEGRIILLPRPKDFFFTSCGSLIPFTGANAQWVFHGLLIALKFTLQS